MPEIRAKSHSQICLLLSALGLAAVFSASIPGMMLGVLIMGVGYGPVTPASSHLLVSTTAPRVMAMVFCIKQTGVPLGGAMAGAVVPHLVLIYGTLFAWMAPLGGADRVCAVRLRGHRLERCLSCRSCTFGKTGVCWNRNRRLAVFHLL